MWISTPLSTDGAFSKSFSSNDTDVAVVVLTVSIKSFLKSNLLHLTDCAFCPSVRTLRFGGKKSKKKEPLTCQTQLPFLRKTAWAFSWTPREFHSAASCSRQHPCSLSCWWQFRQICCWFRAPRCLLPSILHRWTTGVLWFCLSPAASNIEHVIPLREIFAFFLSRFLRRHECLHDDQPFSFTMAANPPPPAEGCNFFVEHQRTSEANQSWWVFCAERQEEMLSFQTNSNGLHFFKFHASDCDFSVAYLEEYVSPKDGPSQGQYSC